ncbi:hypothetical protein [Endozoicomonas ascidiicola]|uniref:hypothetical protein n=1 Tax=Endozoicomonas ascidiicola TaxID=1698521 RepID=UPI0008345ED1|nr:hypothetical protein [Endozoicomonas ascidiicola]
MATRKVKILKDTMAGGEFVQAGKEIEVSQRDAHTLTNIGKAQYVDRDVQPEELADTEVKAEELTDREMTSDNTATSKGKKK